MFLDDNVRISEYFFTFKNVIHDLGKTDFIALIHLTQWIIAKPVSIDRLAKHQKKTSCVTHWRDRSSTVHSLGGMTYFLPV